MDTFGTRCTFYTCNHPKNPENQHNAEVRLSLTGNRRGYPESHVCLERKSFVLQKHLKYVIFQ